MITDGKKQPLDKIFIRIVSIWKTPKIEITESKYKKREA